MTNSEQELLQQLHDIHLPTALSTWPFAPGWYVVLGIISVMLIGSVSWAWCWYQRGKVKREALRLLLQYEKSNDNNAATIAAINELLKRVALAYFPRERVAALYGKDWLIFLNETSKNLSFLEEGEVLISGPYVPTSRGLAAGSSALGIPLDLAAKSQEVGPIFHLARQWIAQRGKPCLS